MFLLLHAFNSLASHTYAITKSRPPTGAQNVEPNATLANTPAPTRYGCTFTWSASTSLAASMVQSAVAPAEARCPPRRPRCVHGPVAPAEARCPPRRPVAPTAMLETHSDAMLTTTRASPAMAVLALLDEIEDLLGSRQARSTTSSICRTVESNLCMHAVPVHLRQSRPSSKEAVPVRSGDRRSRSHPNKRRPSFDLLM